MLIILPASILSFSFWSQTPANGVKPAVPAAKPPAAAAGAKPVVTVKPGVPKVGPPVASPIKAAATKAVAIAANPKPPGPGDPVVLTVGEDRITKSQFEDIMAGLPDQYKAQLNTPKGKREFAKQYGEMKSLALEARKKMQQDAKLQAKWNLEIDQQLVSLLMKEMVSGDPAALRKYYDEHLSDFSMSNGRHILIRFKGSPVPLKPGQTDLTEEEALAKVNDIRKQLAAGGDFAELAKKESDDTGSGATGGSLGDFARGVMVPPFDQAAFSLPIGEVSDPVRTQFGYHIIQIQSRKPGSFEQAKEQIGRKLLEEIKKRDSIVLDEAYFGKD